MRRRVSVPITKDEEKSKANMVVKSESNSGRTSAITPLLVLPRAPTVEELRRWMHGIGFAEYTKDLAALEMKGDDIRHFTPSGLVQALALPSLGSALDFVWALCMSDVRCENLQRMDERRTVLSRLTEFEVAELFDGLRLPHVGALLLRHHVTGKGVEILDMTDLREIGLVDVKDIRAVLQVQSPARRSTLSTSLHGLAVSSAMSKSAADRRLRAVMKDAAKYGYLLRAVLRVRRSAQKSATGSAAVGIAREGALLHPASSSTMVDLGVGMGGCLPTSTDGGAGGEYTYITHLIEQPAAVDDPSQWGYQAIHSVYASRFPMPEAWECVPSSLGSRLRSRPKSGREVIVVGVLGPSGVGKSSLCRRLGYEMKSPFEPLQSDWHPAVGSSLACMTCVHICGVRHMRCLSYAD